MKKIIAFLILLLCLKQSYAQYPLKQYLGSDSTLVTVRGGMNARLVLWSFTDTTQANTQRISQYAGALIYTTGTDKVWYRNSTATGWIEFTSSGGTTTNLYNSDGFITGTRVLDLSASPLTFSRSGVKQFAAEDNLTTIGSPNNQKRITVYNDSITILGLSQTTDTTTYKPLAIDADGYFTIMDRWPGSSTPTLQQVLTAGSTLTQNNTIEGGTYNLKFNANNIWDVDSASQWRLRSFRAADSSMQLISSSPSFASSIKRLTMQSQDSQYKSWNIIDYDHITNEVYTRPGAEFLQSGNYLDENGFSIIKYDGSESNNSLNSFDLIGDSSRTAKRISYTSNINGTLTDYSLTTKKYVDSVAALGGGSYTFTNGLTNSSGTVKLGGALTQNTSITNASNYDFKLSLSEDGDNVGFIGTTYSSLLGFENGSGWLRMGSSTYSGLQVASALAKLQSINTGTLRGSDIEVNADEILINPSLGGLYIDTLTSAVGTKTLRYNTTTGLVSYADTTTGGSTNTSVGSGYKVAIDATNNIKSLTGGYGITLDSATSNQVGIKADTATLFPAVRATIPAGSTINKVGQDFFISNDSLFLKDEANIYDYGATAGGDILIPLKAALASSKKTIIIPNANFTISDTVIVPSYKRIIGNTGANITQTTSGKGILILQQDSYVSGVEFIGTGYSAAMPSSVNGEYGVKIVGSRVEVDNCKFSLLEHGVIFGGLTVLNRCIIKDNLIYANKGGITAFQNIEYSTIINNRIYDGYIGIWLRDEANLLISNNTITYNTVGIRWDGLASNSDHDIVIGNQFNHCDTMAYVLKNNTSLDFIGNHFMVGKIVMGTTDSVRLHTFNGNGFGSTTFSIINGREINFVNNSFYNPSTWTNSVGVKKYLNVGETNDALPGASISGTDNNIVRIDGTTSLQDSKVSISDNGDITAGNSGTSAPVLTVQDYGNNYALGNTQSSLLLKGRWWSGDSNPSLYSSARIDLVRNAGDGAGGSNLVFKVSGTGATGLIEAFRATSYKNFLINYATDDGNKKFRVDYNDAALTSLQYAAYITQRSTFNTTGGNIISTGAYIGNTSSRSSGGNSLTNIGLQVDASGGQNNYGIIVSSGSVGIGTQSPTVALDVVGAGKFTLASGYATNINGSLGANDFATKGYADSLVTFSAATYTPSLTNTTNIAASTAYTTYYQRVGDVVHVWGEVEIDATTALTVTELGMELPIASSITNSLELAGTAAHEDNTVAQVKGDPTNDRAKFRLTPQTNTANVYSFHFSYKYVAP